MSDRFTRADTLTLTGSSITHGLFSPAAKSRNVPFGKTAKTEISVNEMIGVSKAEKWGIDSYSPPLLVNQMPLSPKYSIGKEKGQSYMERVTKKGLGIPDPGNFHRELSWKSKLGVMKGAKRQTYIELAMKRASKVPSPDAYRTEIKKYSKQGKFEKAGRSSVLDDIEFIGKNTPPPYGATKDFVLNKVKSAKILPVGKHDKPKHWKTQKEDSPDPCSYKDVDRGLVLIKTNSPRIKFDKRPRKLFTDDIIKSKKGVLSPGHYNSIDESKIAKVMARSRRC